MTASNILRKLARNSQMAIDDGTYEICKEYDLPRSDVDLARDIKSFVHASIISEIKFASPSEGRLRTTSDPAAIAAKMVRGGARGLSVLTQPHLFGGCPEYFAKVRQAVDIPMLMKDVIIDKKQIDAAACIGADYILLIWSIFEAGLLTDTTCDAQSHAKVLGEFTDYAHSKGLGVLLEVHTQHEYDRALNTKADIIGINNRNLDTLEIDTSTTCSILNEHQNMNSGKVVISESGITTPDDIRRMRKCGAEGFLVGSSIMKSTDIEKHVMGMVMSY